MTKRLASWVFNQDNHSSVLVLKSDQVLFLLQYKVFMSVWHKQSAHLLSKETNLKSIKSFENQNRPLHKTKSSQKHLCAKVTPSLHLKYIVKMGEIHE